MKKLISIIMMVVLCATVFVACKKDDVTGSDIAAAGRINRRSARHGRLTKQKAARYSTCPSAKASMPLMK